MMTTGNKPKGPQPQRGQKAGERESPKEQHPGEGGIVSDSVFLYQCP